MKNRYTYGPVPSRRLGFSLGIDIVPHKYCSFNCIYCQLGKTTKKTIERCEYTPTKDIIQEIQEVIETTNHIDYLTFSGSGEPTLHSKIGFLIERMKKLTDIPVAVLTNGSLLSIPTVQKELLKADVVLPTLCTTAQKIFERINRPFHDIKITDIITGMISFRKIYENKIWLEIMLVKGINDSVSEIQALKEVVNKIQPDKIHLNTVVRPPSEKHALPLSYEELEKVRSMFGSKCEIIADYKKTRESMFRIDLEEAILDMIKRRPVTVDDICNVTHSHRNEILKYLERLREERKIRLTNHNGREYYEAS